MIPAEIGDRSIARDTGIWSLIAARPWVLVAGGFHRNGGMDKANAALAEYLLECNATVHLVGYDIASDLAGAKKAVVHRVRRWGGSYLAGDLLLSVRGGQVARQVTHDNPRALVIVNGGNCVWSGTNWVHSVIHAWPCCDEGAPVWFRAKNRLLKAWSRYQEKKSLRKATRIIANSEMTRRHLIDELQLDPSRIQTIYLGAETDFGPVMAEERTSARASIGIPEQGKVAAFVGALSYDRNKGLDTLLKAWHRLAASSDWNCRLLVAGSGSGLPSFKEEVKRRGLSNQVKFLGHTNQIRQVLAASDLLISPVRYEAYGLNAQEAVCSGIPVLISSRAGFSERLPGELAHMRLMDPNDPEELALRLRTWDTECEEWKHQIQPFAAQLRKSTWRRMAEEICASAVVHG